MASTTMSARGGWYYGWNIVAICMLSQVAANGLIFYGLPLFLKPWSEELHAPISSILLAYLPMLVLSSLLSPFFGALADRKPARLLLGLGLLGLVLVHLAMSAATKLWQIQALYALALPIPVSLTTTLVCNPLVSRWFVRRAGLALGMSSFGIAFAGILLPPFIAAEMPIIGWRNIWLIGAIVIGFIILPVILLVTRDRPTEREGLHYLTVDDQQPTVLPSHHGPSGGDLRWTDVLKRKNFWLLAVVLIAVMGAYMGCQPNLVPIALSRGIDQKTAGLLISVFSVSHVASTLLMGAAVDKLGSRAPLVFLSLSSASGALLIGFGSGLATLVSGGVAVALGGGVWAVLAAAIRAEFGTDDMGRAFGVLMMMLMVPAMAPSMVARVQEQTGGYGPGMAAIAVVALLSATLILQLRERRATVAD